MIERTDPVNWSTLKELRPGYGSPKHYLYRLANPREDTDALLRGRVLHCAIYEPTELDKRYAVMPNFHGGQRDETARSNGYDGGREAKAAWIEAHRCTEIVPTAVWDAALGCATAVLSDPIAGPMVRGGYAEQRITWTDARTGIECRGQVDHLNGRLSDLKSTASINWRSVMRDIVTYGYHGQLAHYDAGLRANGIPLSEPAALIFVEATPPHDVLVVEMDEDTMYAGLRLRDECLDILAECRATGQWPGVSGGFVRRVELPEWAMPDMELTMGGEPVAL